MCVWEQLSIEIESIEMNAVNWSFESVQFNFMDELFEFDCDLSILPFWTKY